LIAVSLASEPPEVKNTALSSPSVFQRDALCQFDGRRARATAERRAVGEL